MSTRPAIKKFRFKPSQFGVGRALRPLPGSSPSHTPSAAPLASGSGNSLASSTQAAFGPIRQVGEREVEGTGDAVDRADQRRRLAALYPYVLPQIQIAVVSDLFLRSAQLLATLENGFAEGGGEVRMRLARHAAIVAMVRE